MVLLGQMVRMRKKKCVWKELPNIFCLVKLHQIILEIRVSVREVPDKSKGRRDDQDFNTLQDFLPDRGYDHDSRSDHSRRHGFNRKRGHDLSLDRDRDLKDYEKFQNFCRVGYLRLGFLSQS